MQAALKTYGRQFFLITAPAARPALCPGSPFRLRKANFSPSLAPADAGMRCTGHGVNALRFPLSFPLHLHCPKARSLRFFRPTPPDPKASLAPPSFAERATSETGVKKSAPVSCANSVFSSFPLSSNACSCSLSPSFSLSSFFRLGVRTTD